MKGKMHRLVGLLLVAVLCATACAACPPEEKPAEKPPEAPPKPRKVVFWHGWTGAEEETLRMIVGGYVKENPGVEIELLFVSFDQLREKFATAAPAGEGPDLLVGPSDWVGQFATMKAIASVDKYIADMRADFLPVTIDLASFKGQLYAFPESFEAVTLIYNKALLEKVPETTDELISVAKKLTGGGQFGLAFDYRNFYFNVAFLGGFGGKIFDAEYNPTLDNKETADYLQFIADMLNKHRILTRGMDYNVMMEMFKTGKAAMIINGPWCLGDLDKEKVDYGLARIPKVSATGKWSAPFVGGKQIMLSAYAKETEAAVQFARHMVSPLVTAVLCERAGHIPSNVKAYEFAGVKRNWRVEAIKAQAEVGVSMPNVPEMQFVWDVMSQAIQTVLDGKAPAQAVAARAQNDLEAKIQEMRGK